MPETKPVEKKTSPPSLDPARPPAETPVILDKTQLISPGETVKAPDTGVHDGAATVAAPPAAEPRPAVMHPGHAPISAKPRYVWLLLPVGLLFLALLVFLGTRPRQKANLRNLPQKPENAEKSPDLSNYSAFIAKNKALREDKYSEQILTDEPFAGQAPLAVKANGPVITPEIDPQLAALADALRIRVQIMQGSQFSARGPATLRTTKGDFRGFRINAVERVENGVVTSAEVTVITPKNGMIKTVNHVLDLVQKTDFPGFVSEIRNAGLEFSTVPVPPGMSVFRCQVRPLVPWGKPVSGELLIAGKNVGSIALGMPVERMRDLLIAAYTVLKRKVLVNDIYYDVYKILDRSNDTLFYVYEKNGKVWGISIISDAFKTGKGIGIGSTLDLMRLNYPVIKLSYSEKKTPFVQVEEVAGIFIIQGEGQKKIISILVGESPEFE